MTTIEELEKWLDEVTQDRDAYFADLLDKNARLAEAVCMIEGYKRAGWLTNPAAIEQANDFIARVKGVESCKWCGRPVTEQTECPADYCVHEDVT